MKVLIICSLILLCVACEQPGSGDAPAADTPLQQQRSVRTFEDFTLPSLKGDPMSMADYRGSFVVLNFWATWCAPCMAELPSLQALGESLKDQNVRVVAVSVDSVKSIPRVREVVEELGLTFDILFDHELDLPSKLGITGFPETFFITPDGQQVQFYDPLEEELVWKVISDRDWNSKEMKEAISELAQK